MSAALFGEDCEISCDQLYELLKYAALGKRHNATQPRYNTFGNQLCVPTCCENIAEGILAVLVLEYLQRAYHNDSLYYVDTGAIRLAQRPEFLF